MIELLTAGTPNGFKASIMLEETGLPYSVRPIELGEGEQKQDWYQKLNPNGRIPTIIDHDNENFVVFESGAILIYLADKSGMFLPTEAKQRSRVIQWLMFQMAGIGPMQGQAGVFYRYAPTKIPYAIERYQKETRRLYSILDKQLEGRDFLVDELSIADFATYPWVQSHEWVGITLEGYKNIPRWLETLGARPGLQRGMAVPQKETTEGDSAEERIKNVQKILV